MHLVRRRGEVKRRLLSWRTWVLAAMVVGIALWLIDRFTYVQPRIRPMSSESESINQATHMASPCA